MSGVYSACFPGCCLLASHMPWAKPPRKMANKSIKFLHVLACNCSRLGQSSQSQDWPPPTWLFYLEDCALAFVIWYTYIHWVLPFDSWAKSLLLYVSKTIWNRGGCGIHCGNCGTRENDTMSTRGTNDKSLVHLEPGAISHSCHCRGRILPATRWMILCIRWCFGTWSFLFSSMQQTKLLATDAIPLVPQKSFGRQRPEKHEVSVWYNMKVDNRHPCEEYIEGSNLQNILELGNVHPDSLGRKGLAIDPHLLRTVSFSSSQLKLVMHKYNGTNELIGWALITRPKLEGSPKYQTA